MGQFAGEGQVTVMGTPPPFGTAVKVKEENGPPFFGGDAVRLAVFDEVGVVEAIVGPLRRSQLPEIPETEWPAGVSRSGATRWDLTQRVASPAAVHWMVGWPFQTRPLQSP